MPTISKPPTIAASSSSPPKTLRLQTICPLGPTTYPPSRMPVALVREKLRSEFPLGHCLRIRHSPSLSIGASGSHRRHSCLLLSLLFFFLPASPSVLSRNESSPLPFPAQLSPARGLRLPKKHLSILGSGVQRQRDSPAHGHVHVSLEPALSQVQVPPTTNQHHQGMRATLDKITLIIVCCLRPGMSPDGPYHASAFLLHRTCHPFLPSLS